MLDTIYPQNVSSSARSKRIHLDPVEGERASASPGKQRKKKLFGRLLGKEMKTVSNG